MSAPDPHRRTGPLPAFGAGAVVIAVLGWAITFVTGTFLARPDTVEDLTPAWAAAGATALGESTTVAVPPGQTLVAFLVGTDLISTAGTTTGSCSAAEAGRPVDLSWPVQVDPAVDGILGDGQQVVAIAGWPNRGRTAATIEITCDSVDSTVAHFVAVPSRTAAVVSAPWFQPWGWVALGAVGAAAIAAGVARGR